MDRLMDLTVTRKKKNQTDAEFESGEGRQQQEKQRISKSRALASLGIRSCEPENTSLGLSSPRGAFLTKCLLLALAAESTWVCQWDTCQNRQCIIYKKLKT